jgi:hypothetical protein
MDHLSVRFPDLEGRDLQGQDVDLPSAFAGARNVVLVAFDRGHQQAVDSWVPWLEEQAARDGGLRFYEVPTISRRWAPLRPFIDGGMAAAIRAPEVLARTFTVYGDRRRMTGPLAITDLGAISVFLVDGTGVVRWRGTGGYTREVAASLESALATLR